MSVTPSRVLIVGSGAREHALAWKLAGEPGITEVVVAPGSAGIGAEPGVRCLPSVDPMDSREVVRAAREIESGLVVIGPEAPLAAGVADALRESDIRVFGPSQAAARIESSKAFCMEVAEAAHVPGPYARAFTGGQEREAAAFIRELASDGLQAVLKADGLAAGKGVIVTESTDQALALAPSFFVGRASELPALVIQARIDGLEFSVIAIADGSDVVGLPMARDHKRLCDGETGPNTGGMGAYSPLPDLDDQALDYVLDRVHRPILAELARRGSPFVGFLYAGLIVGDDGVPILLECNARLGDPEAQVILPRLMGALGPVLATATAGELGAIPRSLPASAAAAVGVVLATDGYPGDPRRGDPIEGLSEARASGALVFHGGTIERPQGGFGTNGGRVLTVVGRGSDLVSARGAAERAADMVTWDHQQRRHDIARRLPPPMKLTTMYRAGVAS